MNYEYWFDMIKPEVKILTKEEKIQRTTIKMGRLYMFNDVDADFEAGILWLKDSFVNKHLRDMLFIGTPYIKRYLEVPKDPILTKVECPFCEDGVLELVKKEKVICTTHVSHNGDSFTFLCSKRCKDPYIHYSYSYTWGYC